MKPLYSKLCTIIHNVTITAAESGRYVVQYATEKIPLAPPSGQIYNFKTVLLVRCTFPVQNYNTIIDMWNIERHTPNGIFTILFIHKTSIISYD